MRSTSSVAVFWIGVVVIAVVIATPFVRADWRVLAFVLPPALTLAWVLWIVLYLPSIRFDANGVVVVNIGRTHVLPWPRVTSIRQRLGIDFDLEGGGVVKAVAVPPPRRPGNLANLLDRRTRPAYDFSQNAEILEGFRAAAAPDDGSVVGRWNAVPIVIGGVLLVALAIELVIGI
ncbi:hypothetical protein BH09ACT1_BH09ACT1_27010 [soil metagenome]